MALVANANPAKRVWRTMQQSDGSQVQLMLVGDEHMSYYITTDSKPVVEKDGSYYYASASRNAVVASSVLAHNVDSRTAQETAALESLNNKPAAIGKAYAQAKRDFLPNKVGTPKGNLTGSKKGLVILVSFNDLDFTVSDPKTAFSNMCNQEGYNENGAVGSVHDYFYDSSYGQFDLTFDVYGPYKAPRNMSYYGANNSSYGHDTNVRDLIKFAVNQAAADADNNFSAYDWDNDGFVDQVYVIYAGYAESSGADANTIWPHESELGYYGVYYDNTVHVGSKRVNTYACGSELAGTSGSTIDGIGTMCHEFSHCLGLPDFYDISENSGNTNSNYGMFIWDIMDQGSNNGNGNVPPAYTGFERHFAGWMDYRVLDPEKPCRVRGLSSIAAGGEVYQIKNPSNDNEYFLIENRYASTKWDRGLADWLGSTTSGGLLITHVTYDAGRWSSNDVNTTDANYTNSGRAYTYQCMTPVLADNDPDNRYVVQNNVYYINQAGISGDLFGTYRHTSLTATSTPAFTWNLGTGSYDVSNYSLTRMNKRGGVCDFTWMNGTEDWSDTATGISGVKTETTNVDNRVYNLNGQYVGTSLVGLQKGLYIQNGKKVVVK